MPGLAVKMNTVILSPSLRSISTRGMLAYLYSLMTCRRIFASSTRNVPKFFLFANQRERQGLVTPTRKLYGRIF
jgi:hypothetical protein